MPEKCRVVVCGYDPILVRGYVKTGERALWWHLPDELYEDYKVKPNDSVCGSVQAVYDGEGKPVATPNESFSWKASKESGLAVLLPPDFITKYRLTEFHFLEMTLDTIVRSTEQVNLQLEPERLGEEADNESAESIDVPKEEAIYPGQVKQRKWWPEERMKLDYKLAYVG
ncbi:MAG: hypothetical protein ACM3JD_10935 [Rudaea sp.]